MSLKEVEWACGWPLILPYFEGSVPAGFPSPAEDNLETPLDLSEFLIENKASTFLMPRWTTRWDELPKVRAL
jgi:hypothetical protein